MRADVFLVEAGHAATRSQAQRLIAGGVQWRMTPLTPWKKVAKNGDEIPAGAELQLLDGGRGPVHLARRAEAGRRAGGHQAVGAGPALPGRGPEHGRFHRLPAAGGRRPGHRRGCGPWPVARPAAFGCACDLRRGRQRPRGDGRGPAGVLRGSAVRTLGRRSRRQRHPARGALCLDAQRRSGR